MYVALWPHQQSDISSSVKLDGKDLPWVKHAEHIGHTLHQSVTMEKDCLRAKARIVDKTVEVRDQLLLPTLVKHSRCSRFFVLMGMAACSGSFSPIQ